MTSQNAVTRPSRRRRAGVLAVVLATATTAVLAGPGAAMASANQNRVTAAGLATSTPVGRLHAQGCAVTGTAETCDLYAMPGTATVLGTPVPIWGFSTTTAAGSATAPGPVLVVRQGDSVTVTVHNQIPGESLALALPGQTGVAVNGSPGDDLSGIGTGATRTYTFTAGRPGTFLYEAGHTPDGARQVAMGLSGALVVVPADGTAYGTGTAYDDDAVLVMTEMDPRLNADPGHFDMRSFRPAYRMFNGKPYPAADPVSTDQGHTVLLRLVNAGSQPHAITVLGGDQREIAQDGHRMTYPMTVATETVASGQTLDSLVTMPTGPEAKLAVFEPAMHLDNNGSHTADPLQFAFGGLLTFLDTNAPPPSTDGVGPVSSHVTVTPNPSDARSDVTVRADLSDATTGKSTVVQAEFVVDDAVTTGVGFGTPMTATFGTVSVTGATGTIPAGVGGSCAPLNGIVPLTLNCLDAGKHTVFVRALDAAGNWGVVGSVILNLPKTGPQTTGGAVAANPANGAAAVDMSATGDDSGAGGTISAAEYFVDTAGVAGSGTAMVVNQSATVVSLDATLPATAVKALTEGTHHLWVHAKDSLDLWGPVLDVPLVVDQTGPAVDAAAVGPNPTNGIRTDKSNPGFLVVSAQLTDRDAGGALQSPVTAAEAFLDPKVATPTGGSGLQFVAVDGAFDSVGEAGYALIPVSQVKALSNGLHHVWVRGRDAAGNWGAMFGINLLVDKVAPALGALTAAPSPTNGAATVTLSAGLTETDTLGAAEYWTGTTDPGVGKGTSVPVGTVNGAATASVSLTGMAPGTVRFNLRVQDRAGNWSNAVSTSVTITRPNLGTLTGSPNPTNGAATLTLTAAATQADVLTTAEYWTGNADPGVGHATATAVTTANGTAAATVPLAGVAAGQVRFNLRVRDGAGNWSNAVSVTVTVSAARSNSVFTGFFEGSTPGWSLATGNTVTTAAARMVGPSEPASTKGLAVTPATSGTNRSAFVTDLSPAAETTYHAAFRFNGNTLNTGTGTGTWVSILDGQTGSTATVFAVQLHRVAGSSLTQLRLVSRTQASNTVVTLPAGAHTLQLDWAAAATGTLRLSVDGTSVATSDDAGAAALRLETVRLGATNVAGGTGAPSGTALFDGFTSTRYTMP